VGDGGATRGTISVTKVPPSNTQLELKSNYVLLFFQSPYYVTITILPKCCSISCSTPNAMLQSVIGGGAVTRRLQMLDKK
jgi:hypothetical protein